MPRTFVLLALAAFTLFNYAQYRGWSLFADDANAQALRPGSSGYTRFHK